MQTVLILTGVAFGVAVMVFLGALMEGLQENLVQQTLSVQPHIVLSPPRLEARDISSVSVQGKLITNRQKSTQRDTGLMDWRTIEDVIGADRGVSAVAATVQGEVLVNRGSVARSATLIGVQPQSYTSVLDVAGRMISGGFRLATGEAVIGKDLASDLGVGLGDKIRVAYARNRDAIFSIGGVFDMGNKTVNQRWIYVPMRQAQSLFDMSLRVSQIQVRVHDVFDAEPIAARLSLRTALDADSWMKLNQQLLKALRSQSMSRYMIQFFVVIAVALGIASVLVVSVVSKSREIGIMKATGTSSRSITTIFLLQGAMVGVLGSVLGSGIGALFSYVYAMAAKNADGTPMFPVELGWHRFVQAFAIATVLGIVSAAVPARRAAKLDPAKVITHG